MNVCYNRSIMNNIVDLNVMDAERLDETIMFMVVSYLETTMEFVEKKFSSYYKKTENFPMVVEGFTYDLVSIWEKLKDDTKNTITNMVISHCLNDGEFKDIWLSFINTISK